MGRTNKIAELVPIDDTERPWCVGCPTRLSKLMWETWAAGRCEFCKKPYCETCFANHKFCCEKAPRVEKKRKVTA